MSPDQRTAASFGAVVLMVGIAAITWIISLAVWLGHDGSIVAGGVAIIAGLVGAYLGIKIKDILGK